MTGLGLGLGLGLVRGRKAGGRFPLYFDPTGLSAFPSYWEGSATFVIEDDVVKNNPEFGPELLADPGLETYSGEDCTSLIFTGGTREKLTSGVYDGIAAQAWTPDGNYQSVLDIKVTEAKEWYILSEYAKRISGSNGSVVMAAYQTYEASTRPSLISSEYIYRRLFCYSDAVAQMFLIFLGHGTGTFDKVALDGVSFKKVTKNSLVKLVSGVPGYTSKIRLNLWNPESLIGSVTYSDGTLDNCLFAQYVIAPTPAYNYCTLDQYINGTRTRLAFGYTNSFAEGGGSSPLSNHWLEIRTVGVNQVQLFQNDIPIGAVQTVPVELRNNNYYGWVDGGGNEVSFVFVGPTTSVNIGAAGSSNTYSATGYWYDLYNTMRPQYVVTRKNAAANGVGIASYSLPHYDDLAGSEQVIFDTTGDTVYPDSLWHIEAFLRKCHADGYRVLVNIMPVWSNADLNNGQVNTPANLDALEAIVDLLNHYGIPHVNMLARTQAHVLDGGNISDWFGDVYHLTDAGQLVAANALAPFYVTGGSFVLASRVYAESEALE